MKKLIIICAVAALLACEASGPQTALDNIAKSLEKNNPQSFLAQFDLDIYANNEIKNLTESDGALNAINSFGQMLGLGSIDELLSSVVDFKTQISDRFMRGVASGELVAECKTATTPNCPWVPDSLENATIMEIGPNAAIAKITTPARLTSWICLRKIEGKWLVVGQAVLEARARAIASAPLPSEQPRTQPQDNGSQEEAPASGGVSI